MMNKKTTVMCFSSLLVGGLPLSSYADFLEMGSKSYKTKLSTKDKWVTKISADYLKYPTTPTQFSGKYEQIEHKEYEIPTFSFLLGREFVHGTKLSTTLSSGATIVNSSSSDDGLGSEASPVKVSTFKRNHQLTSLDIKASLNYQVDNDIVFFQPFIEVAAGVGKALINYNYDAKALPTFANSDETYKAKIQEDYSYTALSLGCNIISYKGIFSFAKVTALNLQKTSRKITGSSKKYGETSTVNFSETNKSLSESYSSLSGSIGFGYHF